MELNSQQKAAVETEAKRVLVEAAPGSGKTRVIIERIHYLIDSGVSPFEILCLTFTRNAAREMKERLENRIGSAAYKITIGTFHSIALDHLQRYSEFIGFKNNSTVYSDFEENYLLKETARDIGFHDGKSFKTITKKEINFCFYNFYNYGKQPDKYEAVYSLFQAFNYRCKENNSYTYGSILTEFRRLIPHISGFLSWKHIICDESQDNNSIQFSILELLSEVLESEMFLVSDMDQTIYEFRGSFPDYLLHHEESFNIFPLELNYRSDSNIVNSANSLIQNNHNRINKEILPDKISYHPLTFIKNMDSAEIVKLIKSLEDIFPDQSKAILARNHFLLKKISELLAEKEIEHSYIGKKSELVHSEDFRKFHAFLKLIINPYDNFSFLLIRDLLGLSRAEYNDIRLQAANAGLSHFKAWKIRRERTVFKDLIFNEQEHYLPNILSILFESLTNKMKCFKTVQFIQEWIDNNPKGTIHDYLKWLSLYDIHDELQPEEDKLQLMTFHAAKGLEWDLVLIAGMNEGILPSKQALINNEIESERRLCYVAITRAKENLILTIRPEKSEYHGKELIQKQSRFIKEMQDE